MPKYRNISKHAELTESCCSRLTPAADAVVDYYDIRHRNLMLRSTPPSKHHRLGLLTWRLGYRHGGAQRTITIGAYPAWTAKEALKKARKFQVMIDDGLDPATLRSLPEPAAAPVDTLAAMYLDWEKEKLDKLSSTHRRLTKSYFERHIIPVLGDRVVKEITRRDLTDIITRINDAGTPVAANHCGTAISTFFNYLLARGVIETSPAIKLPKSKELPRERVLSLDELVLLWRAAERLDGPQGRFVQLMLTTGTRRREAAELPRSELSGRWWLLPKTRNKSKRDHKIGLSKLARSVIAQCPDVGKFVFSVNGPSPIRGFSNIKADIDRAIAELQGPGEAPLAHFTFHDIRRSIATELAKLGTEPHLIERTLNHAQPKLEKTYNRHDYSSEIRDALQKWSERLERALAGEKPDIAAEAAE